ncbi:radical SAM protein [Ktedonospora formicarum]|uniref:Radical SAM core domain-containing protein n=1 Tax=Ktedonospora formicarum TaxID=2778364 RepID=A0A8J3MVS4_9CHLR|nr:radical SAM protein [Ktedonospora formicarum]GHO47953.1 hypothetical protein KSX_61160 [Ktedonospora formicarum]
MNAPIFREALLKLAARCNLNCTYCYWFRDASVYSKPPILTSEAEAAFLARLEEHIQAHDLTGFSLILHGGEPLLFGKVRFVALMDALDAIEQRTGCVIYRSLTTNGVLVDTEWAQLFRLFRVSVTVSIDGPAPVHDRARLDFQGRGSYTRVLQGVAHLREQGLEPGVLAVCDPASDPAETLHHFVDELGFSSFDILIPDATHDDAPTSIAPYYIGLFDLWREHYRQREVTIRYLRSVLNGLQEENTDASGYNPVGTLTVLTDGALEPVDVLRIAGYNSTQTKLSVLEHPLQALEDDPCWREAYRASIELPQVCQECAFLKACEGGYLPHRWSRARRFANPSVYCSDLKRIYAHIRDIEFTPYAKT